MIFTGNNMPLGLLYFNKAFANVAPEFSSSMTREEAMKYRQFRLKNIASASEELLLMLEHEVRGPLHKANPLHRKVAETSSTPPDASDEK